MRKHGFYRARQRYQCKDCPRQFVEYHRPHLCQQKSTGVEDRIDRYIVSVSTPPDDLAQFTTRYSRLSPRSNAAYSGTGTTDCAANTIDRR